HGVLLIDLWGVPRGSDEAGEAAEEGGGADLTALEQHAAAGDGRRVIGGADGSGGDELLADPQLGHPHGEQGGAGGGAPADDDVPGQSPAGQVAGEAADGSAHLGGGDRAGAEP